MCADANAVETAVVLGDHIMLTLRNTALYTAVLLLVFHIGYLLIMLIFPKELIILSTENNKLFIPGLRKVYNL